MDERIMLGNEEIAEANIELAKNFIMKACATQEKEKIIKNLLIAQNSIQKSLAVLGFKP